MNMTKSDVATVLYRRPIVGEELIEQVSTPHIFVVFGNS